VTYRDVMERLKKDGWAMIRQEGSHQVWSKEGKGRIVIAPHSMSAHVPKGTLSTIRKQAGWK